METTRTPLFAILALLALTLSGVNAQEGNEKARKYHGVLKKRPSPSYLFDHFYNTWLDTDTLAGLETFLAGEIEADATTGNRLLLAFFHTKQGDNVKALEQFRKALEADPGNAETYFQKAVVEARTLDFQTALTDLEKAKGAKPKEELERKILQLEGKLQVRSGQTEKAMAAWKKLLEANPDDEELQEDLIELQIAEGLYDEALKTADTLIGKTKDAYQ
ncbi:MAG: tetratricopeptide repeat protein, partial [Verrucomicrobiota bacterium]